MTERELLQVILDVLDDQLGDSDPHTDIPWDEWNDDDLKAEHPLMWCCRQISAVLGKQPEHKLDETKPKFGTPQNPDCDNCTEAERKWEQHWSHRFP